MMHCHKNNPDFYFWVCIGFGVFLILLSGIFVAVQHAEGNRWTPQEQTCPQFPTNLTYFELRKQIWKQWKWEYDLAAPKFVNDSLHDNFSFGTKDEAEQKCPTATHDVEIHLNGKLAARTDGKILTTVSKNYIRDCHGSVMFQTKTASTFHTIINGNDIIVSFELWDKTGKTHFGLC